jgi:hypothetical protein
MLAFQTIIAVDQSAVHSHGYPGLKGESLVLDQSTKYAGTIAALMIRIKEYRWPLVKRCTE